MPPLKIVVPGPDNIRRRNLETYFQAHGVEIEAMLEMDAMIATLEFVARSDWVTILPSVISVNDIGRGELIVNPIINPELHAEFVVIQPTRRKLSMQARMFLERFEAEVAHIHNIWDRAIAEPARRLPRLAYRYFRTRPFTALARAEYVMRPFASTGNRSRSRVFSVSTSLGCSALTIGPMLGVVKPIDRKSSRSSNVRCTVISRVSTSVMPASVHSLRIVIDAGCVDTWRIHDLLAERPQFGLHRLPWKSAAAHVPRIGRNASLWPHDPDHFGNALGGSGTKKITSAMTATSKDLSA